MTPSDDSVEQPTSRMVPAWLENLEAFGWRSLVVVGLGIVLAWIALTLIAVTASLVLSAVIAAAAAPLVLSLRARPWSRVRAAIAAWAVVGAIIVGALLLVAIAFIPAISDLIAALQLGLQAIQAVSAGSGLPSEVPAVVERAASVVNAAVQNQLAELASRVSTTVTIAILSTFLTFFVLLDADHGADWMLQGVPADQGAALRDRGRDAALRVGALVRGTAAASAVRAAAMLGAMLVLGTPYAGPLAAILLVGGLIPYLGALIATLAIVLVALGSQGPWPALAVLGAALLVEVAIAFGMRRLNGRRALRVHPAIALLALAIGGLAAGVIGLILAVPLAAFLQLMLGPALETIQPQLPTISATGPVVPGWLDQLAQWSRRLLVGIGLLAVFVLLAIAFAGPVLAVVVAAILAATLAGSTSALRRRGASPTLAAAGATVGLISGIAAILILTIGSLVKDVSQIVAEAGAGSSRIDEAARGSLGLVAELASAISGGALDAVLAFAAMPPGLILIATLGVILTFFFLRDGETAWRWVTERLVAWRRDRVDAAGRRAARVLGGYMIATAVISAFGAATQFATMVVLGLPLALPLAVLTFFGGFIPYYGSLITTGLAFLVTVAVGSPTDVVVMAVFTVVFNIVTGNFIAPLVYAKAIAIHPAVVLVAVPAGSAIAGVFGMFIAVPLIGIVSATWRTALDVLSDEPAGVGKGTPGEPEAIVTADLPLGVAAPRSEAT